MTPLLAAEPTLKSPTGASCAWCFDDSRDLIVQVCVPMFSVEVSTFFTGPFEAWIQERFVRRGLKVRVVHDWRAVKQYEPKARDAVLAWSRASRGHIERADVAMSEEAGPFVRIAVQTGVSVMRAMGMDINLVTDLSFVEARFGARSPSQAK